MGNRRLGRKRLEAVLKNLNAQEPDSTGSRSGLRGFEMPSWQLQPAKYFGLFDDFISVSGVTDLAANDDFFLAHAASGLCGATWDVTLGGGGSPAAVLNNTIPGGVISLLAGTADDDIARIFAPNHMFTVDAASSRKIWMEARLKVTDVSDNGFLFGLASTGGEAVDTAFAAAGLDTAIAWQMVDGQASTSIASICAIGDVETVTASTVTSGAVVAGAMPDDTFVILSIYFDGTTAHYYVNGKISHSTVSSIPADGEAMYPHLEFIQQTQNNDMLTIDYVNYCMER